MLGPEKLLPPELNADPPILPPDLAANAGLATATAFTHTK